MAGQMPLEHPVVVQIHCPQPLKPPVTGRFCFKATGAVSALVAIPPILFGVGLQIHALSYASLNDRLIKSARR